MADRRTRIILDLDSGPFKRGLASAAAATKAFTKELDTGNERMSWLVQSSLALGPALVPIGAAAVPAITALSAGLAAAAGAAGVAALAFQGVGDGLKAANEYAMEPSAKNLEKLRSALENLGPAGQEFVLFLDDMRPKMRELREEAQAGLFPGLMDGIDALMTRAPQVQRIIGELSDTVGDLSREAGRGLASDKFDDFFDYMENEARPILTSFGRALGNFTEGLANMLIGFDPLTDQFSGGLLQMSRDFAKWSRNLENNEGFQGFVDYVEQVGPKVVDTLGTLIVALADIVKAAAPIGEVSLPIIRGLAQALAAVAESPAGPAIIGAAAAISALSRAIALSNVAGTSALFGAFQKARAEGGKLGRTADTLAGKFSKGGALAGGVGILALSFTDLDEKAGVANTAMGAMLGSIAGPWGAAIGGGIGLVKDLASANDDLEDSLDGVNKSLQRNNFAQFATDLRTAEKEVREGLAGADLSNFGDFTSPAEAFRFSWEKITGELEKADRKLNTLRGSMQLNWQKLYDDVKFPEGGGFSAYTMSLDDLRGFATRAKPALDRMGVSLKDLETLKTDEEIQRIARGIRNYHREADSVPARSAKVRAAIKDLDNPMLSAADSADRLEAALSGLFDPAINEEEAMIAYRRGVIDLRKQLNKTNGTLNQFTKAGLDNREMIAKQVTNTTKWAVAQARQDGNSKRAIRTLKDARAMLIRVGTASGMSRKQIEGYLKELNFTKGTWRAKLENNANKAKRDVLDYQDVLDALNPFKETKIRTPGVKESEEGLGRLLGVTQRMPDKHDTKIDAPGAPRVAEELGLIDRKEKSLADKHDTKVDAPGIEKAIDQMTSLWGWIDKTPGRKDVNTKAPGAKEAADDIARVDKNMRRMGNKNVTMKVTSKTQGIIDQVSNIFDKINPFNADGRIWDFYAGGGIRENHIAQIAPAGAMRVWAEPETGGEAYIPFAPSKRNRSRAIADETVDRLGGRVLWNKEGAVYANVASSVAPDPSIGVAAIGEMYSQIATEFGKGLGDAMEYALSHMSTGFSWPLPRQYQPSGTWGSYASGGSHPALDWPAPNGTPIYPVFPGRVRHTTSLGSSYGNYTEVDHGQGLSSLYAHQLAFRTRAGASVFPGETIGLVDSTGNSTGPHLHLELKRNGTSFDYTSMLSGGGAGVLGFPGQYHGDHAGLDRASPAQAQAYAHSILGRWGWSEFMWPYWLDLGNRESGWRWNARNQSSGAYGIPQSLPPEKLASAGADWQTNAGTQIDWMGNYIAERYGSPYRAIGWHNANNWYGDGGIRLFDSGGLWRHGQLGINLSGRDEYVNDPQATAAAIHMADGGILDGLERLLQGFNYGPGQRPPRRRRGNRDDDIDTPDVTRRAQRDLRRAERSLARFTTLFARRQEGAKRAENRVDKARKALDDAKGKREKQEAKAALKDAKADVQLAEKRRNEAEKRRDRASREIEKAEERLRESRANQRVLDKAVKRFDLRGGMGAPEVRDEFRELLSAVRQSMGKDSALYKALKRMGENARETGKRLEDERKLRDKLNDRLRSLEDASRQYAQTVRGNFRNDPFTGGLDEFSLQVRADRNDAKSMKRALNRARRKGLSGGLYRQLAASGNMELAQQFGRLDRGEIRRYERLFEQRQRRTNELGNRAADVVYGKRLDKANRLAERQTMVIERLRLKLERIEDRVGDRIERGAHRGVRDGMNGRKKKLQQFYLEARS